LSRIKREIKTTVRFMLDGFIMIPLALRKHILISFTWNCFMKKSVTSRKLVKKNAEKSRIKNETKPITLARIYQLLMKTYGPQGWWPLYDCVSETCIYPGLDNLDDDQAFEVAIGAILAQNVAWSNVAKSIALLARNRALTPDGIDMLDHDSLAALIRSSGYYNQKAQTLRLFLDWFKGMSMKPSQMKELDLHEIRNSLLAVKRIGPETADSILLYALGFKIFVVDAYTRRILERLGIISGKESYQDIQDIFHGRFKGDIRDYREFHALIVVLGKDVCRTKPLCDICPLKKRCPVVYSRE